MDSNKKKLVELLSLSLRGRKASAELTNSMDWPSVYQLAQVHSVLPLVYTALDHDAIEKNTLEAFRMPVYKLAMQHVRNLNTLGKVIDRLKHSKIPVIALKGLILRNLYPFSDTRTMSDFDILVKEQDYEKAFLILQEMGFKSAGIGRDVHIEMVHGNSLLLELHKQLFEEDRIDHQAEYLAGLWENAVPVTVCGRSILTFSDKDTILYLCLHMAKHYEDEGFGLRQLCDIVVFIEAKYEKIDWDRFYLQTAELHITKFVAMIFSVCGRLFGMRIPDFPLWVEHPGDESMEMFIDDIMDGGTFGMSTSKRHASNRVIHKVGLNEYSGLSKLSGLFKFLFPMPDKLGEKYSYIRRFPFLLPIAWIHRGIYNIIDNDQREMMKSFFSKENKQNSADIMRKRRELVNWLKNENTPDKRSTRTGRN